MKLSAWGTLLFLAWAPIVVVADGCSSQHEGERCDAQNGNLDCGAGLLCRRVYVEDYHWICCPIPPALATVAACNASGGPIADAAPPSDAGPDADAPNAVDDATSESSPENDAAGEASADRATNDNTVDIAPDVSVDMATRDTAADTVPTADSDDDATTDAADDLSSDAVPDVTDTEDVTDAPTADGQG